MVLKLCNSFKVTCVRVFVCVFTSVKLCVCVAPESVMQGMLKTAFEFKEL